MPTFTLSALEQRIWDSLDGNTDEFAELNVRGVINEGLSRLNCLTGFNQGTVTFGGGTVAGQLEYAFPAGILFPMRVDYNGRELSRFSLKRLALTFRNWSSDTSDITPVARWAAIGLGEFVIHPIDLVSTNVLEITGVTAVSELVNAGDAVGLDDHFVEILVDYGKQRLPLKEGGKPFASASLAYRDMVRKVKTMGAWKSMAFPSYWLLSEQNPDEGQGAGLH